MRYAQSERWRPIRPRATRAELASLEAFLTRRVGVAVASVTEAEAATRQEGVVQELFRTRGLGYGQPEGP